MAVKSSWTVPIIVAVIGVVGTISAALIANWDKVAASRAAEKQAQVEQAAQNLAASTFATEVAESDTTEADRGMDAAAPINLAGKWTDAGGYEYVYEQTGNQYSFNQFKDGKYIGNGAGSLTGRHFKHVYAGAFGAGDCSGEVSANLTQATSTCTIGPNSFKLRIVRSATAKS